jgi:hypothetical protein
MEPPSCEIQEQDVRYIQAWTSLDTFEEDSDLQIHVSLRDEPYDQLNVLSGPIK